MAVAFMATVGWRPRRLKPWTRLSIGDGRRLAVLPGAPRNRTEIEPKPFFVDSEIVATQTAGISGQAINQGGSVMAAIAKTSSKMIPARSPDGDVLKTVAAFCAVGLVVSRLVASYGLDLSGGFF
jgi:hypothetical protein